MTKIYLQVPFVEKEAAKALGAKWDHIKRSWYAPEGVDLAPLQAWLPEEIRQQIYEEQPLLDENPHTMGLGHLLQMVGESLAQQFAQAYWVRAEVMELSHRRHLYLTLVETDDTGQILAEARAHIWQFRLHDLEKKFKEATGSPLQKNQKLLLKVQVRFHKRYGFSLDIEDIDPSYTLGQLAAELNKLRQKLKAQGLYELNKRLNIPQDFFRIAVIAPEKAAGLGDFKADAQYLQEYKICQFDYYYAQFQGEVVGQAFDQAFTQIWQAHQQYAYDAVVIIRGGGSQTDLHWLNNESIAQAIAHAPIPVLTGIGHERDSTLLDEMAAQALDTPSKVIAFIRQRIQTTVLEAAQNFQTIYRQATWLLNKETQQLAQHQHSLVQTAWQKLQQGRQTLSSLHQSLLPNAYHSLRIHKFQVEQNWQSMVHGVYQGVHHAQGIISNNWQVILSQSNKSLGQARWELQQDMQSLFRAAEQKIHWEKQALVSLWHNLVQGAERQVAAHKHQVGQFYQAFYFLPSRIQLPKQALVQIFQQVIPGVENQKNHQKRALIHWQKNWHQAVALRLSEEKGRLETIYQTIVSKDPEKILAQGFVYLTQNGRTIRTLDALDQTQSFEIHFAQGKRLSIPPLIP